jgi:mannose/cellobiose epimerase-like protein (N-acyl-D-glucosamine 2-epimerase family)
MVPPRPAKSNVPEIMKHKLSECLREMEEHLQLGILPFWRDRGWDHESRGYHTTYDEAGLWVDDPQRLLYTHCRQLWLFAHLCRTQEPDGGVRHLAELGLEYLLEVFQRDHPGTWHWKLERGGRVVDSDCVLYGYSFAIYSLSESYLALRDRRALQAASDTFDFVQLYFADGVNGGYREFLESDFLPTSTAESWSDRKSLDGHLHLMEAYTNLSLASGREIHRRRLAELVDVLAHRMVDPKSGAGWNQFDLAYKPLQPAGIYKMWDPAARRASMSGPVDLTSYGHNAETAWLLHRALDVVGQHPEAFLSVIRGLLDHTLNHGVDWQCGGVFRYGRFSGPPTVEDKDFWPQAECLVAFLDGYRLFGEPRFLEAFLSIWSFVRDRMIATGVGEWRSLLNRRGEVIDPSTGQPWKDGYHTGRCLVECIRLLRSLSG